MKILNIVDHPLRIHLWIDRNIFGYLWLVLPVFIWASVMNWTVSTRSSYVEILTPQCDYIWIQTFK